MIHNVDVMIFYLIIEETPPLNLETAHSSVGNKGKSDFRNTMLQISETLFQ